MYNNIYLSLFQFSSAGCGDFNVFTETESKLKLNLSERSAEKWKIDGRSKENWSLPALRSGESLNFSSSFLANPLKMNLIPSPTNPLI